MPEDTYLRMLPLLKELEGRRRKYLIKVRKEGLTLLAAGVGAAVLALVMEVFELTLIPPLLLGVAAVTFIIIGIISLISHRNDSEFLTKYREVFRNLLIPEILRTLEVDAHFNAGKGISGKAFQSLSFFNTPHDQFHSSDKITGSVDGVSFSISNVHSQMHADAQGSYLTQFQGFFLMLEFNKAFKGRTYVLPDNAERLLGKGGRSLQKAFKRKGTKLIHLDDPEFEKVFTVYSTDEIEARYILSHSMMKRLCELRGRFGERVRFSFRDNFVCLAIPTGRNYLLPKTNRPATSQKQFRSIYRCLKMLLGIVHDLDLTTRIWSKT